MYGDGDGRAPEGGSVELTLHEIFETKDAMPCNLYNVISYHAMSNIRSQCTMSYRGLSYLPIVYTMYKIIYMLYNIY